MWTVWTWILRIWIQVKNVPNQLSSTPWRSMVEWRYNSAIIGLGIISSFHLRRKPPVHIDQKLGWVPRTAWTLSGIELRPESMLSYHGTTMPIFPHCQLDFESHHRVLQVCIAVSFTAANTGMSRCDTQFSVMIRCPDKQRNWKHGSLQMWFCGATWSAISVTLPAAVSLWQSQTFTDLNLRRQALGCNRNVSFEGGFWENVQRLIALQLC
jgi:hypothetical protein